MLNDLMRKRKKRSPKNDPKNPNYQILREKLKRKRERRQVGRVANGKKPLSLPLTMVNGREQRQAYGRGKLLLMDGNRKVQVPLVTRFNNEQCYLQGVYKVGEEIVILRTTTFLGVPSLNYFTIRNGHEEKITGFFDRREDIAHVYLTDSKIKGRGLGIRASVKAEKEYRAIGGKQPFFVADSVAPVFEKMHYKPDPELAWVMSKNRRGNQKDDMEKNHVIEAIDPVTGKIKSFTFHIKKKKK